MKKNILVFIFISYSIFAQNYNQICAESKIEYFTKINKLSKTNYPGDSNIDVTYYKLNLSLNYFDKSISGIVTINAKSEIDNLTNVYFDLQSYFNLASVKLNGDSVTAILQNDKIEITLDKSYNIGEEFSFTISYSGIPGSSGFGSFEFGDHNGEPAIWTLSEPYGASDWWPSKDTPSDKADSSDVWITSSSNFVSVSNGKLMAEIDNGDGTKTYKWKNSHPISNYLISLAMTNYTIYEQQFEYEPNKYMPVVHYNYPENFNVLRQANLDKTTNMLEIFSNIFGPYPFLNEKYGHAEFGWGGGMEHQTVSSMGFQYFSQSDFEYIVAHELAHQWFGDKITCKDWQNIWLNEGFASYAEALYAEVKYGEEAYKNYLKSEMSRARNAVGSIYVQNISSLGEIFSGNRSYAKGSVVLHMLRRVVGNENFFSILKSYMSNPDLAYNVATTEDFQNICEAVSGEDLNYFFNEWIYGENYLKYTANWNYSDLENNLYLVNLSINQQLQTDPQYFTMPIDIKVTTTEGDTTITVFNNQQSQNFEIVVNALPIKISVDPENWILKDSVAITTNISNNEKLPKKFSLDQNYPNPFNPVTSIKYSIPNVAQNINVSLKVFDVLGKEIQSLVNESQYPGTYRVIFNAENFPSGIYYYRLKANNYSNTKKMIFLK